MSSEARLFTFSTETKEKLRKFRLGTSKLKNPKAVICMSIDVVKSTVELSSSSTAMRQSRSVYTVQSLTTVDPEDQIDKQTLEVSQEKQKDGSTIEYSDMQDLADDLQNAPRYILLSYPLEIDGRATTPYVMLYYLPATCSSEQRMLYAGAKELMRNTAEVNRIIDIDTEEDLEEIEEKLRAK